jgi:dienelactone hydrolase
MRRDIEFTSGGMTCRGWLYEPDDGASPRPGIVMANGFSGVKEMGLPPFAARLSDEGFSVLLFDFRYLGASDGMPRCQVLAHTQLDDLRAGLSFLGDQADVDEQRLALWGCSYGGGHALVLGALDPRVKVVIGVVPALGLVRTVAGAGRLDRLRQLVMHFQAGMNRGDHPTVEAVAPDNRPAAMPGEEAYKWLTAQAENAPNWRNEITVQSLVRAMEYVPAAYVDLLAPKPLLLHAAKEDDLVPLPEVQEVFRRAGEPKQLEVYPCRHFEIYDAPYRDQVLESQVAWLNEHLV